MIVKDEEDVLARCLKSVSPAVDEIIIVDTGSTDSTKKIASAFTDNVYDFKWRDDFSAARNFAFSKATCQYLMWLDADDVISPENLNKLISLKQTLSPDTDMVYMKYDVAFDNGGEPVFSYYRGRLIKNCEKARFVEPVHETIVPFGKTVNSDISVWHKKIKSNPPRRNLRIFEKSLKEHKSLSPRMLYYYGRELKDNGKYKKAAVVFRKFLKNNNGWIENNIGACRDLSECYLHSGETEKAKQALINSFIYAAPRAEICCELGIILLNEQKYADAEFWFLSALNRKPDENTLGFVEKDYYGFIPAIELAVLYDKIGNREKAVYYHKLSGQFKPQHPSYLANAKYFGVY